MDKGSEPLKGRQETFCQLYSQGTLSATQAYIQAGYSRNGADGHATRLVGKGIIKARIGYLQGKMAEKHEVTRETIAGEAENIHQLAIVAGNLAAANGALVIKAKAYGLQTDKIVDDRPSEAAQALSQAQEADAREFAAWKLRRQLKSRSAG